MGEVAHISTAIPPAIEAMRQAMQDVIREDEAGGRPSLRLVDIPEPEPRPISPPYIAAKFTAATFATFEPHPQHPSQRAALDIARSFCRRIHEGEPSLLALIGTTGTGKSHLLYAAAKALHQAGHRVFTRPWYLLADHLRFGGPAPFSDMWLDAHQLRHRLFEQSIVMIDEVRPTAGTDFDDTELAKIVCHAWDNGRSVLVTTNVSPLTAVIGPAVASRFTQVTVTGPDRRQS